MSMSVNEWFRVSMAVLSDKDVGDKQCSLNNLGLSLNTPILLDRSGKRGKVSRYILPVFSVLQICT